VVGNFSRHQLLANAADTEWCAVTQAPSEGRYDANRSFGVELLDRRRQGSRQGQRSVDCGHVAAGLSRRDQLATDAGAGGELRLGESTRAPVFA
jgi:hypothetical protein